MLLHPNSFAYPCVLRVDAFCPCQQFLSHAGMFHGLNQYQGHYTVPLVRLEPVTAEVEHSTSTPLSSSTVCSVCFFKSKRAYKVENRTLNFPCLS